MRDDALPQRWSGNLKGGSHGGINHRLADHRRNCRVGRGPNHERLRLRARGQYRGGNYRRGHCRLATAVDWNCHRRRHHRGNYQRHHRCGDFVVRYRPDQESLSESGFTADCRGTRQQGAAAMNNLYEILDSAHDGEAMVKLGREFGLTPAQTQSAVMALLPAISMGLKQSTATPEGLGNLFGVMGLQRDLQAMHGDPKVAFTRDGRAAGNDILSMIFGSPDVSRAVADQAQQFSGVSSDVLKKMLPVLAGIVLSGLMGSKPGKASPQSPTTSADAGGALGDVLGQIFGRGAPGPSGTPPSPQQIPIPGGQVSPVPPNTGEQPAPGGDLLGHVLRELEKGIREGRIKPVIIEGGPFQIPMPGGQGGGPVRIPMPGGQAGPAPQMPGGDILGQILRDLLGGAGGAAPVPPRSGPSPQMKDLSDLSKQLGVMGGAGAAVFGDRFEVGREVEQDHLDNIQGVFANFFGSQRR